ncbi:hypothetical protein DL93DRAFT_2096917 [Clavulina sp. PMI_390]|nr:hypothetical protein DL93DRAFT_2096917 [Clavulina sp. PMI_390]
MSQPSTFGVLLRRSKFASYDPAISQIYTAPQAHVHRGDFGLKRPMPPMARKKLPYVVVSNVDTREYQTAWVDAERQAKFVKRLDETGISWEISDPWANKTRNHEWMADSEFAPSNSSVPSREDESVSSMQFPRQRNIYYVPPAEFSRYVSKIRSLRPKFHEFLEENRQLSNAELERQHKVQEAKEAVERQGNYGAEASSPRPSVPKGLETEPTNLYATAQVRPLEGEGEARRQPGQRAITSAVAAASSSGTRSNGRAVIGPLQRYSLAAPQFLASHQQSKMLDPSDSESSSSPSPAPHKFAGLSYHHPSPLQAALTSPPIPGFVMPTANYRTGYMAEPPKDIPVLSAHEAPPNMYSTNAQSHVVHAAGTWAAEYNNYDVWYESSGSTKGEQRVKPFRFFDSSTPSSAPSSDAASTASSKATSAAPGFSTFRPMARDAKIVAPPPVVTPFAPPASSTPSSSTSSSTRAPHPFSTTPSSNSPNTPVAPEHSIHLALRPWATAVAQRPNPYYPGTPNYVAAREDHTALQRWATMEQGANGKGNWGAASRRTAGKRGTTYSAGGRASANRSAEVAARQGAAAGKLVNSLSGLMTRMNAGGNPQRASATGSTSSSSGSEELVMQGSPLFSPITTGSHHLDDDPISTTA